MAPIYRPTNVSCLLMMLCVLSFPLSAQKTPDDSSESIATPSQTLPIMTNARLDALLRQIDDDIAGRAGQWQFTVAGRRVLVITDERAGRMRILSPILQIPEQGLSEALMLRMLQANFDSALDTRYSVANGTLWSAFIHPLNPMSDAQLLNAISQVISAAETFGQAFSSGGPMFRGGDSAEELRKLQEGVQAPDDAL